jgi:hypothetical protein
MPGGSRGPVVVEEVTPRVVDPLEGMGAEKITLGLDEVGRKAF